MPRAEDYLRSRARCEVTGVRPEEFLNRFSSAGGEARRVSRPDAFTLRLTVAAGDLPAAKRAAALSCCDMRIISERGPRRAAGKLRRRAALAAAGLLSFALLAASSLFVWDIEVEGNSSVPTGEILLALAECGAAPGTFWPGWDADAIENHVLLAIPELSWLGVSVSGSRAEIRVRERIPAPELASGSGSVTARTAGIIERMEVFSGKPSAAVGQAVAEGQELVSGTLDGGKGVHASARVTARTFRELTACAPIERTALAAEDVHSRWALVLGGKRVNFYSGSSQTPPGCGKIIEEFPLAVEGVFSLPVTLVRERVVEYAEKPVLSDAAALEAELAGRLAEELRASLGEGGEVLEENCVSAVSGNYLYVTLRAECREDIAAYTPAGGG